MAGPARPVIRCAAGWPLWLAGGAALMVGLSGSSTTRSPDAATALPLPVVLVQEPDTVFRHQDHARVECLTCHTVDPVHGEVRVRTLSDCRSCHHQPPLAADCARCHTPADVPTATYSLPRSLELSVGVARERPLPFQHSDHPDVACVRCHTDGLALSAAEVDCASCHEEHHSPEARCAGCHLQALETPPHPLEVHVGCGGAGCHSELPFEGVPRTRNFCVTCHEQQEDHRPGQPCANCHLLPRPRQGGAGGGEALRSPAPTVHPLENGTGRR